MEKIFKNATVLDKNFCFEKSDICVKGINFCDSVSENAEVIECDGKYIVPGLVDIHTHGCLGFDSADCKDESEVSKTRRFYASHGITTYLATVTTSSVSDTEKAVALLAKCKSTNDGANIGGIHLEGPYFSNAKKGAQNPDFLRTPDISEFEKLYSLSCGSIRRVSIAPELADACEFISKVSKICSVSIGHTDADYDCTCKAIDVGATGMTHTFNGMRPLHHRDPNAVGAALDRGLFCEFICDGFHINEAILRISFKILGDEKMLLISDSIRAAGMSDGQYTLSDLPFTVKAGKARLADGTIAGSTSTLFDGVKNAISFGIPAESAFKMASVTPARACGIDNVCGSIENGKRADMLILDKDFNIEQVVIRGKFYR